MADVMEKILQKLQKTFEVAPWLKESKNAVHMSVNDPTVTNYPKSLPQLTWSELYEMTIALKNLK